MNNSTYVIDHIHIHWKSLLHLCDSYFLVISLGIVVSLRNNMSLLITKSLLSRAYSYDLYV